MSSSGLSNIDLELESKLAALENELLLQESSSSTSPASSTSSAPKENTAGRMPLIHPSFTEGNTSKQIPRILRKSNASRNVPSGVPSAPLSLGAVPQRKLIPLPKKIKPIRPLLKTMVHQPGTQPFSSLVVSKPTEQRNPNIIIVKQATPNQTKDQQSSKPVQSLLISKSQGAQNIITSKSCSRSGGGASRIFIAKSSDPSAIKPIQIIPLSTQNGSKNIRYVLPNSSKTTEPIRLLVSSNSSSNSIHQVNCLSSTKQSQGPNPIKLLVKGNQGNSLHVLNGKSKLSTVSLQRSDSSSGSIVKRKTQFVRISQSGDDIRCLLAKQGLSGNNVQSDKCNPHTQFKVSPIIFGSSGSKKPTSQVIKVIQPLKAPSQIDQKPPIILQYKPPPSTGNTLENKAVTPVPSRPEPPITSLLPKEPVPTISEIPSKLCSRRDMLTKLQDTQRRIFYSILYRRDSSDYLDPKAYYELFKKFSPILKKLLTLRKLIRKYEGSSTPTPISKMGVCSDNGVKGVISSYQKELKKELELFNIDGSFFYLRDSGDFLSVMLSALETKGERSFFVCRCCCGSFKNFHSYMRHLYQDHPVLLRCNYCEHVFISALDLKDHIRSSSHGYCRECEEIFKEHTQYIDHLRGHEKESSDPIKSSLVLLGEIKSSGQLSSYRDNLLNHFKKHIPMNGCYSCSNHRCKLSFESLDKLFEHFTSNHIALHCSFCSKEDSIHCSELDFFAHCKIKGHVFCPVCECLFRDRHLLSSHMSAVHYISLENKTSMHPLIDVFPAILQSVRCSACGFNSLKEDEVRKHILSMSSSAPPSKSSLLSNSLIEHHKKLVCLECQAVLIKGNECAHHRNKSHSQVEEDPSDERKQFSIEIFLALQKIKKHARYSVDQHNKRFVFSMRKSDFLKKVLGPLKEHFLGKRIRCLTCRLAFTTQENLATHVDEFHKDYTCKDCSFTSRGKKLYEQHVQSAHPKIMNQSLFNDCPEQPFSFKSSLDVLDSQGAHANHICQLCGMGFTKEKIREEHILSQHKNQICDLCHSGTNTVHVFMSQSAKMNHIAEKHKDLACTTCPPTEDDHHLQMFVSRVNHESLKHQKDNNNVQEANKKPFLPTGCGLCPDNTQYFFPETFFDHVLIRHPSVVICKSCPELPLFHSQRELILHFKEMGHYNCYLCRIHPKESSRMLALSVSWIKLQRHLKERHAIVFCWNCKEMCTNLKGHRRICSSCDAVHCLTLGPESHICSKADLELKSKWSNCDTYKVLREKSINKYLSSRTHMSASKLGVLLEHIFKREWEPRYFKDILLEKPEVPIEEAIAILLEMTNSPVPNEYLVKLWRDFSSLLPSTFFDPVNVKMEVDVDPSSLLDNFSDEEHEEQPPGEMEVVVKEEILDEEEQSEDNNTLLTSVQDEQSEDSIIHSTQKEFTPLSIKEENMDDFQDNDYPEGPLNNSHEDDSALLEDIDDILGTTQKSPIKKGTNNRKVPLASIPKLSEEETKTVSPTQQAQSRSLRSSLRASSSLIKPPSKSGGVGSKRKAGPVSEKRQLRKRTKTS